MNVGILRYPDGRKLVVVSESSLAIEDFIGEEINKHGLGKILSEVHSGCPVIALSEEATKHYETIARHLAKQPYSKQRGR